MTTLQLRVRHQGRLATLRGIELESVEPSTTVSTVPGCAFCMALVRGQIIPVLHLGGRVGLLVVGRVRGEVLGVTGLDIVGFDLTEASDESQPEAMAMGGWQPTVEVTTGDASDASVELDVEQWVMKMQMDQRLAL